jgi:hypothetical protein
MVYQGRRCCRLGQETRGRRRRRASAVIALQLGKMGPHASGARTAERTRDSAPCRRRMAGSIDASMAWSAPDRSMRTCWGESRNLSLVLFNSSIRCRLRRMPSSFAGVACHVLASLHVHAQSLQHKGRNERDKEQRPADALASGARAVAPLCRCFATGARATSWAPASSGLGGSGVLAQGTLGARGDRLAKARMRLDFRLLVTVVVFRVLVLAKRAGTRRVLGPTAAHAATRGFNEKVMRKST